MQSIEKIVSPEIPKQRLDHYLVEADVGLSRSKLQNLIKNKSVWVNGKSVVKSGHMVVALDTITIQIPDVPPPSTEPENIPLDILYEDEALLVVNKPSGMVVHPAAGHRNATLVNALLYHCKTLSGIGEAVRPGIVHRLDKDTSGLLVVAKKDQVHMALAEQLAARHMSRMYYAIVWGAPRPSDGTITGSIGRHPVHRQRMAIVEAGRTATTHYQTIETLPFCSVLSLKLETGRTHQIRVHCAHQGYPVFGDATYGGRMKRVNHLAPADRHRARSALDILSRQALHSIRLTFTHPETGQTIDCQTPVPDDINLALDRLRQ